MTKKEKTFIDSLASRQLIISMEFNSETEMKLTIEGKIFLNYSKKDMDYLTNKLLEYARIR